VALVKSRDSSVPLYLARRTAPAAASLVWSPSITKRSHVHDLLNDLGKEAVMTDIKVWIEARLPRA